MAKFNATLSVFHHKVYKVERLKDVERLVPQVSVLNILKKKQGCFPNVNVKQTSKRERTTEFTTILVADMTQQAKKSCDRLRKSVVSPVLKLFQGQGQTCSTSCQPYIQMPRVFFFNKRLTRVLLFYCHIHAVGSWPLFVRRLLVVLYLAEKVVK